MENLNMPALQFSPKIETNPAGYPLYPVSEDIYQPSKEEVNIDPEDSTGLKEPNEPEKQNEKKGEEDTSGTEPDIPGSALDDADKITGSKAEENNHYSLGGDMLNNPEEDHGE